MANKLADMHEIAPQLTEAVAKRITTIDLHDKALRDLGAFVHRTVVEDEHTYAVRIDDGALLDGAEQIEHARSHLARGRRQIAAILGVRARAARRASSTRSPRAPRPARSSSAITGEVRDRARNGRYAFVHDRGPDFAAGIWVVDPAFMLDLVYEQLERRRHAPAREEAYFAGARLDDDELRDAAAEDEQRRVRPQPGTPRRPGATSASDTTSAPGSWTHARPSSTRSGESSATCSSATTASVIAYGAGWTDPERQRPVGDTGRHEPRQLDAIIDAELERALEDPDPLRGIAQLTARLGAAFVLDPAGVTRTKALGSERMARKLRDALPGGDRDLRTALWEFMRPMLSPALVELNRDAFVIDARVETTVDLDAPPRGVRPRRARPRRRARRRGSVGRVAVHRPPARPNRPPGGRIVVGVNSPYPFFGVVVDPAREIGTPRSRS